MSHKANFVRDDLVRAVPRTDPAAAAELVLPPPDRIAERPTPERVVFAGTRTSFVAFRPERVAFRTLDIGLLPSTDSDASADAAGFDATAFFGTMSDCP